MLPKSPEGSFVRRGVRDTVSGHLSITPVRACHGSFSRAYMYPSQSYLLPNCRASKSNLIETLSEGLGAADVQEALLPVLLFFEFQFLHFFKFSDFVFF